MRYRSSGLQPHLPRRTVEYLEHGASEGMRNSELFDAACQFRDAGIDQGQAEERLLARALADGLDENEASSTIRSAFAHTARQPVAPASPTRHRPAESQETGATKRPRFAAVPVALPSSVENGFLHLLDACFRPEEFVSIAPAAENEDGTVSPRRGVSLSAAEWRKRVEAKGGIDRCFSTKHGLFMRMNPVCKDGASNDDVTAFRHVLVEFDRDTAGEVIAKDVQFGAIVSSGLPVSAVIDSGNKSIHAWVRVDAPDAGEYRRRVDIVWDWLEGLSLDKKNKNPSRLSRCPGGWRTVDGEKRQQHLIALGLGARSWEEWERAHSPDGLPKIVSAAEFMATPRSEPPQIVAGVLHQGCKMIIGGASKARKSWTLIDLAVSVGSGTPWWNFPTHQGRVLYVNFELPEFAFQQRLAAISAAKAITDFSGIDLWNLRGYATDFAILIPKILARIKECLYVLIILDPVYKGLGARDENKAGDIASLCNEIEKLAVQSGAAVAFGAHYSKGNQSAKEAIDRIGGSGVFARDPDVILTMTSHEDKDAYVVDLALRALPQVEPFVVRWQGVHFQRDAAADPARLRGPGSTAKASKASYRLGSMADLYGELCENMPPLKHHKDPSPSEVVEFICSQVHRVEGQCSLAHGARICHAFACMCSRSKKTSPIIFDRATRLWRGRNYTGGRESELAADLATVSQ
jgi:RecA-family ATPase